MTTVTTVILNLASEFDQRDELIETINAWLFENGPPNSIGQFQPLPDPGCPMRMEEGFYYGAFNDLPEMSFVDFLRSLDWIAPDSVQVLIKHVLDDRFHVHAMRTKERDVSAYVRETEFLRRSGHHEL